ncbi:hypothetical protein PSTG_01534 [Puccinia striiformis f. sp. tritici PST-78]|uniref:Tc1-like transposase DDE domain-containing protein n=1 Tax=Puccinia striiformis f. sp. tritici PST-78 TaxID=1165861 RepID=A0A0L0W213_9BASI|nr:hypothetical protein PSTG_01534 [Puccinia striiformis f. sp. tritici PST-78]
MAISKACRVQRSRRATEAEISAALKKKITRTNSKLHPKPNSKHHPPHKALNDKPVIFIPDDETIPIEEDEMLEEDMGKLDGYVVLENYEEEVKLINEVQQMVEWCEETDQPDEIEEVKTVMAILWPISFSNNTAKKIQKLKSGNKGYKLPVRNSNSESKKLVRRTIPRTTRFNYKKNNRDALGENNNMMTDFLKKGKEEMLKSHENNQLVDLNSSCHPPQHGNLEDSQAYQDQINKSADQAEVFKKEFQDLEKILIRLKNKYASKKKKNPKLVIPTLELDELQEFNILRLEYRMNGVPKPSIAASSSNRWLQKGTKKKFSNSVYQARCIRCQAKHVIVFNQLQVTKAGKGGKHTSILDDTNVHEALSRWSATQKPGHSPGRLIHISDFILESTGRLVLSQQQQQSLQLPFNDAAKVIYPGSQGNAWWDMQQLCDQVSTKALPIVAALHPGCQAVFVFDCSAAHESYGPSLRVQNMNLSSGGKQAKLKNTFILSDDPNIPDSIRGDPQTMVFPSDYHVAALADQPKGIQQVLTERGLWQHYTHERLKARLPTLRLKCVECAKTGAQQDLSNRVAQMAKRAEIQGYALSNQECLAELGVEVDSTVMAPSQSKTCRWSKILASQSDFQAEKPLLQMIIEEAGHRCLFLPKFHCELNPIELLWSYIKTDFQRQTHTTSTWKQPQALFEKSRKSCPISAIRKYFRKIDRQHSAYELGLQGRAAEQAMKKYMSHRCIPKSAMMSLNVLCG